MTVDNQQDIQNIVTAKRFSDFEKQLPPWARVLIGALGMAALACAVYRLGIMNPNMILVTGLVAACALLGAYGGIPAAVIMAVYTMYFFSSNHDFVTFDETNAQKVIVSAIGIAVIAILVCFLKKQENDAFERTAKYMKMLEKDNELLEEASSTDALTGIHNRFSLRNDYDRYIGQDLHVMMVDLDDFKHINDKWGHEAGDKALEKTGTVLTKLFDGQYCYRYGGDEFLIIRPGMNEETFTKKCKLLQEDMRDSGEGKTAASFSAGYVSGKALRHDDLRKMIREADAQLYKAKKLGKNRFSGTVFQS